MLPMCDDEFGDQSLSRAALRLELRSVDLWILLTWSLVTPISGEGKGTALMQVLTYGSAVTKKKEQEIKINLHPEQCLTAIESVHEIKARLNVVRHQGVYS